MKILVVIDMQNDFITGPLGTPEAVAIVPKVRQKIEEYHSRGDLVIFTRDTHMDFDYLDSREGRYLPIKHCLYPTHGWEINEGLVEHGDWLINKESFGFNGWHGYFESGDVLEIIGVCTDICVVSNALILRSQKPELEITVDASCCAGTTPENHKAALQVMKSCQINVINE